jgi:hypothetical protein
MELSPYLDTLQRELHAAAAPGGPEVTRTAELLSGSLDAAARLCLLEALADAAAEITGKLGTASVEVRLRGRNADFAVTELTEPVDSSSWPPMPPPPGPLSPPPAGWPAPPGPPPPPPDSGDLARITLRLPEPLKAQVERLAAAEGISVNAWLVRAIANAVTGGGQAPPTRGRPGLGRRVTGFAQA